MADRVYYTPDGRAVWADDATPQGQQATAQLTAAGATTSGVDPGWNTAQYGAAPAGYSGYVGGAYRPGNPVAPVPDPRAQAPAPGRFPGQSSAEAGMAPGQRWDGSRWVGEADWNARSWQAPPSASDPRSPAYQPAPGGYPRMPGYPGGGFANAGPRAGAPRFDQANPNDPYAAAMRGGTPPTMGDDQMVHGGPYMRYQPAGYPRMPGYPGQSGYGNYAGDPGYATEVGDPGMMYGGGSRSFDERTGRYGGGQRQQGGPYMTYGQPAPQQRAEVQPYRRPSVPLAHQVNPMVWDALGPVGQELARGAIGATGQDPGQYEYDLNQSRPRGTAPRGTDYRYAPSRGVGGF